MLAGGYGRGCLTEFMAQEGQRHFQMLTRTGPYPQIVLPSNGFWQDGVSQSNISVDEELLGLGMNSCARFKMETDETSHCYRRYFFGRVRTVGRRLTQPPFRSTTTSSPGIPCSVLSYSPSAQKSFLLKTISVLCYVPEKGQPMRLFPPLP